MSEMLEDTPVLETGYYHPTTTFAAMREHICVMDTSRKGGKGDGDLIALFGPSPCGGATEEEAAESRRQAQLFIAAPKLLAAVKSALDALQDVQGEWLGVSESYAPAWTHPIKQQVDALKTAIDEVAGGAV